MPNKNTRYYISTLGLKARMIFYHLMTLLFGYGKYKRAVGKYIGLHEISISAQTSNMTSFSVIYHSFSFFTHSSELAKMEKWNTPSDLITKYNAQRETFNPIHLTYYALVLWNQYCQTAEKADLDDFKSLLACLDRLAVEKDNRLIFYYRFDYPRFKLCAPWHSGITQGQALSCFLRLNHLASKRELESNIHKIYNSLVFPLKSGGLLTKMQDGSYWIEEYPNSSSPHVLNGFLFALISLYEYELLFHTHSDKVMLRKLTDAFFNNYHLFERGRDLKYSTRRMTLANIQYQGLHVFQMYHLYHLSGNAAFKKIGEDWTGKVNWNLFAYFHGIRYDSNIKERLAQLRDH